MATGAAPDGLFRPIYEGCISGYDNCVERRPYHRNCGCALHSKSGKCTNKLPLCNNLSYPMRRAWSEGSLVLAASAHSSPSSSPAGFRPQHDEDRYNNNININVNHNSKLGVLFEL